ncbi:MAG: ABC transporter substrate-binding protein, partial [Rhizobiaceae bacterium]
MKRITITALVAMATMVAMPAVAAEKKALAFVVNAASDFWKLAE